MRNVARALVVAAVAAASAATGAPEHARAAYPGVNGQIALAEWISDGDCCPNAEIVLVNPDGTGRTIIQNPAVDIEPSTSGNGQVVAFARRRSGDAGYAIYAMNADGTDQRRVADTAGDDNRPSISANGARIVFHQWQGSIWIVNTDGSGLAQLTAGRDPVFSPDGTRIAFRRYDPGTDIDEIRTVNVDGSNDTRVMGGDHPGVRNWTPAFSPDGGHLLVRSNRDEPGLQTDDIYSVRLADRAVTRLTDTPGIEANPVFSPDGSRISFWSDTDQSGAARSGIYTADAGGNNRSLLVPTWDSSIGHHWGTNVNTNQSPVARFTHTPAKPLPGKKVTLKSTSTDPDGVVARTRWDLDDDGHFDDGSTKTVTTRFQAPGQYRVGLEVMDDKGAVATKAVVITVKQCPNIYLPPSPPDRPNATCI